MLRRFISSTQKGPCSAAEIGCMSSIFYRISLFLRAVSALTFPILLFTQEKNRSEIESGSKAGSQFPLRPLDFLFPSLLEDFGDDQTKQPNGYLGKGLWEESWGRKREREGEGEREREWGGGGWWFSGESKDTAKRRVYIICCWYFCCKDPAVLSTVKTFNIQFTLVSLVPCTQYEQLSIQTNHTTMIMWNI